MLDDGNGRYLWIELADQLEGGIGVVEIVVAEGLALELLCRRNARPRFAIAVERGPLMRVLTVTHDFRKLAAERAVWNVVVVERTCEPVRDRGIVRGGPCIGFSRKLLAQLERHPALLPYRLEHALVIVGIDNHSDVGVVLGRRADHRGPADVDVLDRLRVGGVLGDGCLERIEVDHHQVDGADPMLVHRRLVRGVVAHGEEPAMHLGVQRFDPAVHHLGKAREIRNVTHRSAGRGDQFARPSR